MKAGPGMIAARPVWIRLPKQGETEYWTGLTREVMARLARQGKVKSRRVGEATDPNRRALLIKLESLLAYIEGERSAE